MLCDLTYTLPTVLYGELLDAAIVSVNALPDTKSGPHMSPYQIITGRRPKPRSFKFGTVGLCYSLRADTPDDRAEWGIFLDNADNATSNYRVFVPTRGQVYSKRKFVESTAIPAEWKLTPRLLNKVANPRVQLMQNAPSAIEPTELPAPSRVDFGTAGQVMSDIVKESGESHQTEVDLPISAPVAPQPATTAPVTPARARPSAATTPADASDMVTPAAALEPSSALGRRSSRLNLKDKVDYHAKSFPQAANLPRSTLMSVLGDLRHRTIFERAYNAMRFHVREDAILICNAAALTGRLTVKKALNHPNAELREKCTVAISNELTMLWNVKTFKPVHKATISRENLSRVYPCHMFLKEKFLASGAFDKVKARLVAGGDWVEPGTVGETSSPTVNTLSVMMILNIAAFMKFSVSTHDVTGAFLVPELIVGERPMYLWLDKELTDIMAGIIPEIKDFVDSSTGSIYFRIMRYLYGLPQASFHFYRHMDGTLKKLGFERLLGDECVYHRGNNARTRVIVAVHVDDLLAVGYPDSREKFQKEIEKKYALTSHSGPSLSYIGLDICVSPEEISVSQRGYLSDMLEKFEHITKSYKGPASTPGSPNLTSIPPMTSDPPEPAPEGEDPQSKKKRLANIADPANAGTNNKVYLSVIMSLMWLARMTRADILFPTTYLASRAHTATAACLQAAARILKYLHNMPNQAITFKGGGQIKGMAVRVYCDASHGTHVDGKGHGGIMLTMGSGYIHARSTKVKMVTLSSTETEQYVMCDATTYADWGRYTMRMLGFATMMKPTKMYQDNEAAIGMTRRNGTFARTKHIMIRGSYVRESVERGDTKWCYKKSADLMPDMLTKCLPKAALLKHMKTAGMSDFEPEDEA
jgi:hypothetical protein